MAGDVTYQATTLATPPSGTIVETEDQGASIQRQVVKTGAAQNFATSQVSVAATLGGTQILAVNAARMDATIMNTGTTDVYIGVSGVTTSTGMLLPGVKGASITIPTQAAIFGIVATGTQTVTALETF